MFSRIKSFLDRHKRKLFIGGAIVGGVALLSRYAEYKLLQWHEQQTRTMLEKQKKHHHYENTQRTANATVMSLAGSMREVVCRELDTDALLQAVRDQPEHKLAIWEQLKVVGFSRAISVVYISSLVASAIRVQLMLLGGYTYGDLIQSGHAGIPISQALQQKYLAAVHYLVEEGIPRLAHHVTRAVTRIVTGLPLTRSLTLSQLEAIYQEVRLILAGESGSHETALEGASCKLDHWSKYVLKSPVPPEEDGGEERVLYNMLIETVDVIDSEDFNIVMDTLIQHGFNHLLDRVADFYPMPKSDFPNSTSENWVDNVSRNCPAGVTSNGDRDDASRNFVAQNISILNDSVLPVAKLVPVFSGIVHAALSPAPGQLLQKILTDSKLDTLGANVYEAFAVPLGQGGEKR